MRFLVLGATGGIGRLVLEQALARGHSVTAFVRSPQKIQLQNERLLLQKGDPLNTEQLAGSIPGHDAVISSLGSSRDPTVLQNSAHVIVSAMKRTSVRRILVVSVGFLFPETGLPGALLRGVFLRNVGKHAAAMESILMREPLDWTIVRPPRLTNAERSGNYRVMDDRMPKRGFIIPRADVADFLLNEAEKPAHIRRIVGVCK
jgi:putative NADH-flavin reductase